MNIANLTLLEVEKKVIKNYDAVDNASYTYYDNKSRTLSVLQEMADAINTISKYKKFLDEDYINDLIKTF